jgi:hypothetical protein
VTATVPVRRDGGTATRPGPAEVSTLQASRLQRSESDWRLANIPPGFLPTYDVVGGPTTSYLPDAAYDVVGHMSFTYEIYSCVIAVLRAIRRYSPIIVHSCLYLRTYGVRSVTEPRGLRYCTCKISLFQADRAPVRFVRGHGNRYHEAL